MLVLKVRVDSGLLKWCLCGISCLMVLRKGIGRFIGFFWFWDDGYVLGVFRFFWWVF